MEAFEQFVAVFLEQQNYVVGSAVKFPFKRQTKRQDRVEFQTHGYEIDLIAARADHIILATVKSYLGSRGVVADHVLGTSTNLAANKLYVILMGLKNCLLLNLETKQHESHQKLKVLSIMRD